MRAFKETRCFRLGSAVAVGTGEGRQRVFQWLLHRAASCWLPRPSHAAAASAHATAGTRWAPAVQSVRNLLLRKLRCGTAAGAELCLPLARPLCAAGY